MNRDEYSQLQNQIIDALDLAYFTFLKLHNLRDDLSVNELIWDETLTKEQRQFLSGLIDCYYQA